jgi:peptide subunit release factor RF-3
MKRICPNPIPWHAAFERLSKYAQDHVCSPPSPPKPLILAGWVSSNGVEKMERWAQTLAWATPPWRSWSHLSRIEAKRRTFTSFRASINAVIAPHKVDHIDFIIVDNLEHAENMLRNLEKTSLCKKE